MLQTGKKKISNSIGTMIVNHLVDYAKTNSATEKSMRHVIILIYSLTSGKGKRCVRTGGFVCWI